ncbi:MAG: aminoacyltransferase [Bifidobacteriaceae bacterium]|jgi:lipid II:glycine glycyltransferase (peptidoglycan interpeptide bridge formation enzyme)|nr:aminoacyltransferase [Bifidobacteriaceae bacterium]
MPLTARPISPEAHLAWIANHGPVSFLQTPAWGRVKTDWRAESVGVFDGGQLCLAALMLLRPMPVIGAPLAYLPEVPLPTPLPDDAAPHHLRQMAVLDALAGYAASQRAFAVTAGPAVWWRRWTAPSVKAGLAGPAKRFADLPPDQVNDSAQLLVEQLKVGGWRPPANHAGFAAGQPDYVFQLPLEGLSQDDVWAGLNQLWRRNVRKAERGGVEVRQGDLADLPTFHRLYVETAERDQFTPRPAAYFERMWREASAEAPDRIALYLAMNGEQALAATIAMRLPGHTWYVYGASATAGRELRGSNAVQWAMVRDAIGRGDAVYDMRGIVDTLDPDGPQAGLIQFKVGTGGRAQQYVGEWTRVLRPAIHRAFQLAMARRERGRK